MRSRWTNSAQKKAVDKRSRPFFAKEKKNLPSILRLWWKTTVDAHSCQNRQRGPSLLIVDEAGYQYLLTGPERIAPASREGADGLYYSIIMHMHVNRANHLAEMSS
jgi:hypothetical protein